MVTLALKALFFHLVQSATKTNRFLWGMKEFFFWTNEQWCLILHVACLRKKSLLVFWNPRIKLKRMKILKAPNTRIPTSALVKRQIRIICHKSMLQPAHNLFKHFPRPNRRHHSCLPGIISCFPITVILYYICGNLLTKWKWKWQKRVENTTCAAKTFIRFNVVKTNVFSRALQNGYP